MRFSLNCLPQRTLFQGTDVVSYSCLFHEIWLSVERCFTATEIKKRTINRHTLYLLESDYRGHCSPQLA